MSSSEVIVCLSHEIYFLSVTIKARILFKVRLSSFGVHHSLSYISDSMMSTIGLLADGRKERSHPDRRTIRNLHGLTEDPVSLRFGRDSNWTLASYKSETSLHYHALQLVAKSVRKRIIN